MKLRSGRVVQARGMEAADASGAHWRMLVDGGSVILASVDVRSVEALPAAALEAAAEIEPQIDEAQTLVAQAAMDGGLALVTCDPTSDPNLQRWDSLVDAAATRHGVDASLVRAIISVESCGNPSAVSRKGAIGLMQLLPSTAADYGCKNLRDPASNIDAGCRHLARLVQVLGPQVDLVVAAYNAGEGVVQRTGGVPRYKETRDYVRNVMARIRS